MTCPARRTSLDLHMSLVTVLRSHSTALGSWTASSAEAPILKSHRYSCLCVGQALPSAASPLQDLPLLSLPPPALLPPLLVCLSQLFTHALHTHCSRALTRLAICLQATAMDEITVASSLSTLPADSSYRVRQHRTVKRCHISYDHQLHAQLQLHLRPMNLGAWRAVSADLG